MTRLLLPGRAGVPVPGRKPALLPSSCGLPVDDTSKAWEETGAQVPVPAGDGQGPLFAAAAGMAVLMSVPPSRGRTRCPVARPSLCRPGPHSRLSHYETCPLTWSHLPR